MEKISRRLYYICRNWYYLLVELSGWMGSVSYGLGADLSLPPCLSVTIGIWTLAHKSDLRAEISGSIVGYDALAPRPEVLLSWFFVGACAPSSNSSSYHIRGNETNCVGSSEYMTVFTFTKTSIFCDFFNCGKSHQKRRHFGSSPIGATMGRNGTSDVNSRTYFPRSQGNQYNFTRFLST